MGPPTLSRVTSTRRRVGIAHAPTNAVVDIDNDQSFAADRAVSFSVVFRFVCFCFFFLSFFISFLLKIFLSSKERVKDFVEAFKNKIFHKNFGRAKTISFCVGVAFETTQLDRKETTKTYLGGLWGFKGRA